MSKHTLKNTFLLFAALIILYVLAMSVVYAIPNAVIQPQINASLPVFESEGNYPQPFFNSTSCRLDNYTDKLMIQKAIKVEDMNPVKAGMYGYARYWHGYQVFLRPLLTKYNYTQIRYLSMFLFFLPFCIVFSMIKNKLGTLTATAFLFSLMMGYSFIVPMSMQFMSVYMVTFLAIIWLLTYESRDNFNENLIYLFFSIGSLINFFDLLTAPLITLGLPLIIVLLLNIKKGIDLKTSYRYTLLYPVVWALGYGLTWFAKWALGTVILRENVFESAFTAIVGRSAGNAEYPLNRILMLQSNIAAIFSEPVTKWIALVTILWLIFFLLSGKSFDRAKRVVPFLIVGLFPYVWFMVLGNHSEVHFWFTYRIQIVTVFALFSAMICSLDSNTLKKRFIRCE